MAVTERVRLDVSRRPIAVTVLGNDRLAITVCNTSSAAADRRLIESNGGLTIVMLPVGDYGTATTPGAKVLPEVGAPIDPALPPFAPATRVGLSRPHVDPLTGRRGVSFALENKVAEAFQAYAKAHPGEFAVVALDGIVMTVVPIAGQAANARFSFTGDYTEAEARLLAAILYKDPLRFPLEKVRDVEIPAP